MDTRSEYVQLVEKLLPVIESLREWTDESLELASAFTRPSQTTFSDRVSELLKTLAARSESKAPPPAFIDPAGELWSAETGPVVNLAVAKRLSVALRDLEEYLHHVLVRAE